MNAEQELGKLAGEMAVKDVAKEVVQKILDETNPKDILGMKKPPLRLVPPALIIYTSFAMAVGARKYGAFNWRNKKVRRTVYLEAAMRHLQQALDGEDADHETGKPHEASVAACMAIILDAMSCDCMIDDRPPKGPAGKLIAEFTEK
jgi:hypothetical protein